MSKNIFEQIEGDDSLPENVKQETLSNVYALRMVLDLADLFLVKSANTMGQTFQPPQVIDNQEVNSPKK